MSRNKNNLRLDFVMSPSLHPELHTLLMAQPSRIRGKYLTRLAERAVLLGGAGALSPTQLLKPPSPHLSAHASAHSTAQSSAQTAAPHVTSEAFDDSRVGLVLDEGFADAILDF
jgi:hypothetical protein